MIGGSMKIANTTGFIPVMAQMGTSSLHYMQPSSDAAPYYTVDSLELNPGSFHGLWGWGVPRDASYNILNSAYPVQVVRHVYGGAITPCAGYNV